MRKKIVDQELINTNTNDGKWLDVQRLARVEITSEDAAYPIENIFEMGENAGWRASKAGRQTIRIMFDEPQRINNILVHFEEKQQSRTQEFALCWTSGNGTPYREIVRQQFTFSPDSTTREQERYTVNLEGVKTVELTIYPSISGDVAYASLATLRFE